MGAVGQTLYEPGTGRPLKIWTQLPKNCDTGAADPGSEMVRQNGQNGLFCQKDQNDQNGLVF